MTLTSSCDLRGSKRELCGSKWRRSNERERHRGSVRLKSDHAERMQVLFKRWNASGTVAVDVAMLQRTVKPSTARTRAELKIVRHCAL